MSIIELIRQLNDDGYEQFGIVCKVKAVNGMNCECEPVNGNADILDVRMVADDSDNKYVLIPKVGSFVIVEFLNNAAGYVSLVSEISEVKYKIGDVLYSVNDAGFLMQKGDDNFKEALLEFVEAVEDIIVFQGRNPDREKLASAKQKFQNILR